MKDMLSNYNYPNNEFYISHSITCVPSNPNHSIHIHDHYEIYYFISGDVNYYIEGQTYNMRNNELLIINNKELHRPYFQSEIPYERITIHFNPAFITSFSASGYNILSCFENKKLGINNKLEYSDLLETDFHYLISRVQYYVNNNSKEKDIMMLTILIQILVSLNNAYYSKADYQSNDQSSNGKKVNTILEYINNNLSEKLTLDMFEKKFFINKYYLCHIFKVATGFTIQEYITYKRIMKAKELLSSGVSIQEASSMVGFNDYSNFYRVFKKIMGKSPKHFK